LAPLVEGAPFAMPVPLFTVAPFMGFIFFI
jgi:hypothetical protein